MQLFSYRSAQSVASHVDHGPDVVNPEHPVYDVVRALTDGTASLHEARIAMAMSLDGELKGFRQIEEASGLTDDTLLKVIPEAGASTTLLSCTNRGKFAFEEEDRRVMSLNLRRYRPSAGHPCSLTSRTTTDQEIRSFNPLDDQEAVEEEPRGVREMSKDVLDLLDPSLDLWTNATEGCKDREQFGDAGWALAVVTGLRATTLALDEISRITRVGERQTRRIVDKLVRFHWARRIREGRRVRVVVDFSMLAHEDHRDSYLKTQRRARKALVHQHEGKVLKHLGSKIGRLAKEIWEDRKAELKQFRAWAQETGSRCWNELIKILEKEPQVDKKTRVRNPQGIHYWLALSKICEYFRSYLPKES